MTYKGMFANYRRAAVSRQAAALTGDELIKNYGVWYTSVLSPEQLSDTVKEINEQLDDEENPLWIDKVDGLPSTRLGTS